MLQKSNAVAVLLFLVLPGTTRAEEPIDFNRDVRPILAAACFHCHGPDPNHREAELRLDDRVSAYADRDGSPAIVPGDPAKSLVWQRIISDDELEKMPPPDSKKRLTAAQRDTIHRWLQQGAVYDSHWSFRRPQRPELPAIESVRAATNPIDYFVLAELKKKGLRPTEEADRETLLRRVTLDVTGLPPTLAEMDLYLDDTSPHAYERLVERLLSSPAFGERMALSWMDAARYGDTSVYHADGPRDMWPWRDWVIDAYNHNKPFDKFTIEQLAGDLIPDGDIRAKIASGFNRNHGTTDEGGAIDEEYRVEYVVDRVKTVSTIWLGLTMECGQCHDHKYDPISQREYYQFFAFFNQTEDRGMQSRKGNAKPFIDVPNFRDQRLLAEREPVLSAARQALNSRRSAAEGEFQSWQTTAQADESRLPPNDAVAHFPLDAVKTAEYRDSVDEDRKIDTTGKTESVNAHHDRGLKLQAKGYLQISAVGDFDNNDKFSYGAWLKLAKNSSGAPIAKMDSPQTFRGYDLHVQGRKFAVHIIHNWPNNAIKVVTKKDFPPNQWRHVFVTYDGSSKASGVKIYVDGKEEQWTIEQDGLTSTIRTDKLLRVGSREKGSEYRGEIDDVYLFERTLAAEEVAAIGGRDPISPILKIAMEDRTADQVKTLRDHYFNAIDEPYIGLRKTLDVISKEIEALRKPVTTVMVMKEMGKPRPTHILDRGSYASPRKDEAIEPGTPSFLHDFTQYPKSRLGMAQWLVDPANPLTARVTMNRYWYQLFGHGLVESMEDFGSQGSFPSHPELLDWLAVEFVESGWDIKHMWRMIVTSSTYRQSSRVDSERLRLDPVNLYFSRGSRFRLSGEAIRDQALAASGLLVQQLGGPGVKPYQPAGLWNEVSLSGNVRFKRDSGQNLYRRGMYTYWKRSAPAPSYMIFDTPTREKCSVRRPQTNTPLQALVTLNDEQFVEASRVFAQRIINEGGATWEEQVVFAYRWATSRRPTDHAIGVLRRLWQSEKKKYEARPDLAELLLKIGDYPVGPQNRSDLAAWSIVANLLLNLDQTLTRE
jgi:hypothetical protein